MLEKGIREALPYYEKMAVIENGIDLLTDIAEDLVTNMAKVEEKFTAIEQLLDAGDKEAALNVIDELDEFEEDKAFFALVETEVGELKEEIQIDVLFSQIEGYAQKEDEIAQFCQISQDDVMCFMLAADVAAYRVIVAIHLEDEDSLLIETNRTDKPDLVFSNITEDSFHINDQKYDVVTKEHVEKTLDKTYPMNNYTVKDIFNEEKIKELEAFHSNIDYFQDTSEESNESHVGVEAIL